MNLKSLRFNSVNGSCGTIIIGNIFKVEETLIQYNLKRNQVIKMYIEKKMALLEKFTMFLKI